MTVNEYTFDSILKRELPSLDNKRSWAIAQEMFKICIAYAKIVEKEAIKSVKSSPAHLIDPTIQHFIDNPLTPDQEAAYLRAQLHKELASGADNPQLLDKLNNIIGISSGKEEEIKVVDFSTAFPDLATAIEYCSRGKPEVPEQ